MDPAFSEELADGALEWAETLYATVPPYRDGWAHIHPQDRQDWLDTVSGLRDPIDQLFRWRAAGQLTRLQDERLDTLLRTKASFDPVIAELAGRVTAAPSPVAQRVQGGDDYDLL
jgi:hypothetical protein